ITFISIVYQGGLVIYLLVSNVYRVAQQGLISRTIYNTPEAKKLLETQAREAEERRKSGTQPKGWRALLGDAAPQLGKERPGANGAAKGGKAQGAKSQGDGTNKPPAARGASTGRTTPPKARSAAARKKKKRK